MGTPPSSGLQSKAQLAEKDKQHLDIIRCWDEKALEWKALMGEKGDPNRTFNSDPVLWKFLGSVKGQKVVDAGCGTGYLALQLASKGAQVIASDISEAMLEEARALASLKRAVIDFRHESSSHLISVSDGSVDAVVSNYVLMDLPDLQGAVNEFFRILKPGGRAVIIFTHPSGTELESHEMYFDEIKKRDRWGEFKTEFIYFHRPLSQYWKSFRKAGFVIEEFDEPVIQDPSVPGFHMEMLKIYRKRAWSVAFLLRKP